jgi:peptidoglycan/LPS O-acetylase OafA/YrhL
VKKKELAMIIVMAVLTLLSFIPDKNKIVTIITNPILWEFCFGIFIAFCYKTYDIKKQWALCAFIAAVLVYLIMIYCGYSDVSESHYTLIGERCWLRVLLWGIPSALLVFGFLFLEKSGAFILKNRIWLLLGNASFAIYLLHTTVLVYLKSYLLFNKEILHFMPVDLWVFIMMAIATLAGIIYYWVIEKNLNRFFQMLMKKKQTLSVAS